MTVENNDPQGGQGQGRDKGHEKAGDSPETPVQSEHGGASDQATDSDGVSEATKSPSNAGDAGFGSTESNHVSEERVDQMAHADGSSEEHDPDVGRV